MALLHAVPNGTADTRARALDSHAVLEALRLQEPLASAQPAEIVEAAELEADDAAPAVSHP
jgi:hypothetical protein